MPAVLSEEFYKHGGGALGMQKQLRTLKIHENGWMSYYKGKELKGYFRLGPTTRVRLEGGSEWVLNSEQRGATGGGSQKIKTKEFRFTHKN